MRDFTKNFKKDFNEVFKNTLGFEQIRKRVIITKDYNKALIVHRYRFVAILFLFALLGGVFLMLATNKVIYRDQGETMVDFDDPQKAVDWADYVFIAKVERKLYTKQYGGTGYRMPYTYYSLTDFIFLKGESKNTDKLLFYGGYDFLNNLVVFLDNQTLPEPGEYYLFTVKKPFTYQYNCNRVEADSYFVQYGNQMRLLSNYYSDKNFNEQNSENKQIIKPYLDALEENK